MTERARKQLHDHFLVINTALHDALATQPAGHPLREKLEDTYYWAKEVLRDLGKLSPAQEAEEAARRG